MRSSDRATSLAAFAPGAAADRCDGSRDLEEEGFFKDEGPGDVQDECHAGAGLQGSSEGEDGLLGADGPDLGPLLEDPARGILAADEPREREVERSFPFLRTKGFLVHGTPMIAGGRSGRHRFPR